jgi:hypothetical protein
MKPHQSPHLNAVSEGLVPFISSKIEGLLTHESRPCRISAGRRGRMFALDSLDWSIGLRYHNFDTRPDTEFKPTQFLKDTRVKLGETLAVGLYLTGTSARTWSHRRPRCTPRWRACSRASRTPSTPPWQGPGGQCVPRHRVPFNSRYQGSNGLADIACHVTGCHSTRDEGSKCPVDIAHHVIG